MSETAREAMVLRLENGDRPREEADEIGRDEVDEKGELTVSSHLIVSALSCYKPLYVRGIHRCKKGTKRGHLPPSGDLIDIPIFDITGFLNCLFLL